MQDGAQQVGKEEQQDEVDLSPEEQLTRHRVAWERAGAPKEGGVVAAVKETLSHTAEGMKHAAEKLPHLVGHHHHQEENQGGGEGQAGPREDPVTRGLHEALRPDPEEEAAAAAARERVRGAVSDFPETLDDAIKGEGRGARVREASPKAGRHLSQEGGAVPKGRV